MSITVGTKSPRPAVEMYQCIAETTQILQVHTGLYSNASRRHFPMKLYWRIFDLLIVNSTVHRSGHSKLQSITESLLTSQREEVSNVVRRKATVIETHLRRECMSSIVSATSSS